jgi:hypothetical protein
VPDLAGNDVHDVFFGDRQPFGRCRGRAVQPDGRAQVMLQAGQSHALGSRIALAQFAAAPDRRQPLRQRILDRRTARGHHALGQQHIHPQPEVVVGGIVVIQPQHLGAIAEDPCRHLRRFLWKARGKQGMHHLAPRRRGFRR